MLTRLRRGYVQLASSAAQLGALGIGVQVGTERAWALSAGIVAAISLLAWALAMRHVRAIGDTPTSRVASAAQGYSELRGTARVAGDALHAPHSLSACVWYRFRIEHRRDGKWQHETSGESDASFLLDDGSGECLVDPDGAQVIPTHHRRWTQGDRRYAEWLIRDGDEVYALGDFITRGSVDAGLDLRADVSALLAEWKRDPVRLRERFDADGNGEIDLAEWEAARAAAHREVAARHREWHAHEQLHVMRAPKDRLYLISTLSPATLLLRYRLWSAFHLTAFFAALVALGWLLPQW